MSKLSYENKIDIYNKRKNGNLEQIMTIWSILS